jgi:hypothetical protein
MATDIVGSLFGVTPEMLQQRQFEMADRQAQEYAQMTPLQRASYGLARGGYQLAGALGGEDPQLRMVSTRNAIARQIDPTDPQSMMRGIQALQQAGDQVGAMQLAAVYQQRMKVLADIGQSEAAAASSRAATGKTVAETSALEARAAALAASAKRYFGGAAGQPEATAQPAAVEAAPAPYFNESVIADLPARVQDGIRTVLGDAAQLRNIPEDELRSARAVGRLNQADALDRQAASILAATQRSARGFSTPAETQEVDAALALLRPPQALPVTRDAPASPTAPAVAAAAPARADAEKDRIADIQRRLNTILPDRDAGLKAAEIEGKQLEDELKALREAAKPTEIERLIARREQLIAGGAQPDSSALQAISGRIANLQGREVSFGVDREAISQEVYNKSFAQLTQTERAAVNKRVEDEQGKKAERGAAKFITTQETEFAKGLGQAQKARYENALTLRDNAISALNTFDQLSRLNDQGLISGSFATGRVGATNLLNTLGLISASDSATLARSENYQKVAGDAILAALGGKLGAGFSNEDRKFIQSLVPQLENSAAARRQLIDFMVSKNRSIVGETTRLIDYAENKRTLNGFVPSVPLPSGGAGGGVQALSDEELRRRYEAARKK